MHITPKAVGYAIHRILTANRIAVGCSISLRELMDLWPESLLRKSDLGKGLEALRKAGHIVVEQQPDGPAIRVLDEDFGLVRTPQDRDAVASLNRLREVRRRPAAHMAGLVQSVRFGRRPGESSGPG